MTTSYVVKVALHSGGSRLSRLVCIGHSIAYHCKVKQMLKKQEKQGNRKKAKAEAKFGETMRLVPMLPTVQSGVHISALIVIG